MKKKHLILIGLAVVFLLGISGGICRGGIISGSYQSAVFLAGKKR